MSTSHYIKYDHFNHWLYFIIVYCINDFMLFLIVSHHSYSCEVLHPGDLPGQQCSKGRRQTWHRAQGGKSSAQRESDRLEGAVDALDNASAQSRHSPWHVYVVDVQCGIQWCTGWQVWISKRILRVHEMIYDNMYIITLHYIYNIMITILIYNNNDNNDNNNIYILCMMNTYIYILRISIVIWFVRSHPTAIPKGSLRTWRLCVRRKHFTTELQGLQMGLRRIP